MRKTYFILLMVFSFFVTTAGIRVIKNGGGVAEMLVLTAAHQISKFIQPKPLLLNTEFTEKELSLIEFAKETFRPEKMSQLIVDFFIDENNNEICRYKDNDSNSLQVSRRAIYVNGKSKKISELYAIVFSCILQNPIHAKKIIELGLNSRDIEKIATRIFSTFHMAQHALVVHQNISTLHTDISYLENKEKVSYLFIEFKDTSVDVTNLLKEKIPCSPNSIQISNQSFDRGFLVVSAEWACDQIREKGVLAAEIKKDLSTENLANELDFKLLTSERIANYCNERLGKK